MFPFLSMASAFLARIISNAAPFVKRNLDFFRGKRTDSEKFYEPSTPRRLTFVHAGGIMTNADERV